MRQRQNKLRDSRAIDPLGYIPVVLASAEGLPTLDSIQDLLTQVDAAEKRGYFLPDEDEQLREVYSRYLAIRSSLFECIYAISGRRLSVKNTTRLPDFMVAYAAACLLVRSASFIVEIATKNPVGRKKLDEPETRYGLEAMNFTRIYKSLTSPRKWWGFFEAVRFFQIHRDEIVACSEDPALRPIVDLLLKEEAFVVGRRQDFLKQRLSYRIHSFLISVHPTGLRVQSWCIAPITVSATWLLSCSHVQVATVSRQKTWLIKRWEADGLSRF